MSLTDRLPDRPDDRGVSPVIGVILMIAITVILAAVIASFVLGLGPGGATPTASFSAEYDGSADELTITLDSSQEEIQAGDLDVQVNSGGGSGDTWANLASVGDGSAVTAGDSATITGMTSSDYEVQIVYTGGEGSSVMQTLEG